MELSLAARRQVTKRLVGRYQKGTKTEKSAVLDQLCLVNGWHRDHARKALRQAGAGPAPPRVRRPPVVKFGPEVIDALRLCWAVLDGPSGKRLGGCQMVCVSPENGRISGHGRQGRESTAG